MRIDSYLFTDKGGREYNEDRVGEKTFDSGSVFVVADGLGGHMFGDLAAECVVQALLQTPPDADAGDVDGGGVAKDDDVCDALVNDCPRRLDGARILPLGQDDGLLVGLGQALHPLEKIAHEDLLLQVMRCDDTGLAIWRGASQLCAVRLLACPRWPPL